MTTAPVILVVDDEPEVLTAAIALLEEMSREVLWARDGEDALALVEDRTDIKLVIADIRMPGMTGIELSRRIRLLRPDLPVALTSGYVEAPPGVPFIPKPWRHHGLRTVIRSLLSE